MSAADEARAEAERRWTTDGPLNRAFRGVFVAGAEWQESRKGEVTDEMVERAARNINLNGWTCYGGTDEPGRYDECEDCRRVCNELARDVLEAALGGHTKGEDET